MIFELAMYAIEPKTVYCPYCGERIEVLIDTSESDQKYIEDCSVCCRPITLNVEIQSDGEVYASVTHENE